MWRRFIDITLFGTVFLIAWFAIIPALNEHVYFIDEYEFVRKSYLFDVFFLKHDTRDPRWMDAALEPDAPQPKVGPYIFGLALHLAGVADIQTALVESGFTSQNGNGNPWWTMLPFSKPEDFPPEATGALSILLTARRATAVFSIASILLAFMVHSSVYGFIVALLLVGNSLFRLHAGFAMTDTMQLAFFLATILLLLVWRTAWMKQAKHTLYPVSILLGVSSALAVGVKVTGLLAYLFLCMHHLGLMLHDRRMAPHIRLNILGYLGISSLIFWGMFYAVHPYLYTDTLQHLMYMFTARLEVARGAYAMSFPDTAISSKGEAVIVILLRTLWPGAWYGNFPVSWIPIDMLVFFAGVYAQLRSIFSARLPGESNKKLALLLAWIGFTFISLIWYLSNDWSRYYLPFVTGICFIQAYAFMRIFFSLGGKTIYSIFGPAKALRQ